jgi:hypothetical protein
VSAVYGSMLAFFSDLNDVYSVFTMRPKTIAGYYDRENQIPIVGSLQFVKPGSLEVQSDLLSDTSQPTFWTGDQIPLNGYIVDENEVLYRRVKNNDWKKLGDMYVYFLEQVVGTSDLQEPDPAVDLGASRYD